VREIAIAFFTVATSVLLFSYLAFMFGIITGESSDSWNTIYFNRLFTLPCTYLSYPYSIFSVNTTRGEVSIFLGIVTVLAAFAFSIWALSAISFVPSVLWALLYEHTYLRRAWNYKESKAKRFIWVSAEGCGQGR
jgi:ABC-type transport system involved in multi-copper enzyme maturation permease subunit